MTIDTACSGSLIGLDVACRYLHSREINAAIIATSNLYLNPEHVMDTGAVGNAHSPTGLCHTFDISADGYVKAEAVSTVIVKRLSDAIRDGDPIRAVIRGSATNSDGRTPGIASPSAEAQAAAIRAAYANAGITELNDTAYLECHGTGTQAGDPMEVGGAGSVFAKTRSADNPLVIGSIKSNLGHAEPAAGISGLMKAVMAIEKGLIPGNPTFETPSPRIDFAGLKVKATQTAIPWPKNSLRRASVNSFGYGGSNVHVIVEQAWPPEGPRHISSYASDDDEFSLDGEDAERPYTIVVSANDHVSLRANIQALSDHLINPRVMVSLPDLAYTLSERRTQLFHRAFVTTRSTEIDQNAFITGKKNTEPPRIGFIFTGQGAQWPQMGKDLLEFFPWTRAILEELDEVLQNLPDPPKWSLIGELTEVRSPDHLRQPEFSQPLVTALQLCIIGVLKKWGVEPQSVVGHSSGEIAAAYSAGFLSKADAIKAAFYRGRAAVNCKKEAESEVVMLAVGLSTEALSPYLDKHKNSAWIACLNSPSNLTVSGKRPVLEALKNEIQSDGHFARLLQVDLAYHSQLMNVIGREYEKLLATDFSPLNGSSKTSMFSSVDASKKVNTTDALYWKTNMVSPVRFSEATREMLSEDNSPNFLVEIGPSGALAGPVSQIKKSLPNQGIDIVYCASWSRGADAGKSLFDVAGRLFVAGGSVSLSQVNEYKSAGNDRKPRMIVDLPNYVWNHSIKYWHENEASKDWRFKKYVHHDLLGSKVLGTSWRSPRWRKLLNLSDVAWLKDHKMGTDILMPGSGFITMALEALYQRKEAIDADDSVASANELCYRFRNIRFDKALVLEEGKETAIMTSLTQQYGSKDWHEFRISSLSNDILTEHCSGLIRIQEPKDDVLSHTNSAPLKHPTSGQMWYKAQTEVGYGFGPSFQKLHKVESTSGQRHCRSLVSLTEPESKWSPQSYYPIHPASLDGCFQTVTPSLWSGERSSLNAVLVPSIVDSLVVNRVRPTLKEGLSIADSQYSGRGRLEEAKSYFSNCSVYDSDTGALLMQMSGLHFAKLDTGLKPDPHTFDRISWKPDITFLTQDQLTYLPAPTPAAKIDILIDLIAHKKPALKVLEVNLDTTDTSCLWFEAGDASSRAAYIAYDFASSNAKSLISAQTKNNAQRDSSFLMINTSKETLGLAQAAYDLIIVKIAEEVEVSMDVFVKNLKPLLSNTGYALFVQRSETIPLGDLDSGEQTPETPKTPAETSALPPGTPASSVSGASPSDSLQEIKLNGFSNAEIAEAESREFLAAEAIEKYPWNPNRLPNLVATHGFKTALKIEDVDNATSAYLCTPGAEEQGARYPRDLYVARFAKSTTALTPSLQSSLQASGWRISEQTYPFSNVATGSVVLVLDELLTPVLAHIDSNHWEGLKSLVSSGNSLLWVSKGAQFEVTDPDNALAHGLFRVIRMEDANAKLTVLDVQSSSSPATHLAIDTVLKSLRTSQPKTFAETEFVERDGILHVQRVVPDTQINNFKRDEREGAEPVLKSLHGTESAVALRAERLGTFQNLTWYETDVSEVQVEANKVEIEVMAAGVNFKDVAVSMGIVPENEYTLGYEAAGIVKRLGLGATNFKVGDRVCFLNNGSYANRLQVPVERTHVIPNSMTFEEAATIPSVYLASMYSLFDMANLRKGQSVLIHSASGGVGLSCIQLAQHMNAEIYVTVGTDEKRKFLADSYGIPQSRIFSSRNVDFAKKILQATNGRGIDVIVNSLTGEMLDESWRICADGGTFVEIGKKDIVDRNMISMEPFDRNCSFRAMDFSYTKDISNPLISRLLGQIFDLIGAGHISPIHPITTFGFDDITSALAYIRSGRHVGKVVISNGPKSDVQVSIRPAMRKLVLRSDASYLVVGGLKGLCGNLAIYMAQQGARRIIVCSRSGVSDEASKKTLMNCLAYGCEIVEAKGDVVDVKFMRKVFREASPAIAGVVQGAMILRDKPYETMTVEEYQTAVYAKTSGTWTLHQVSTEQKQALDFFTMLSSISGIVGKKGQANYSAANTFLDAFAKYRQSLGLRANSVDLGLIEDVGYVAEQGGMDSHFDKRQWTPIMEGTLRKILSYSILQQTAPINASSSAQLITGIGFPLPDDSDLAREARFGYLFARSASSGADTEGSQSDQTIRAFLMMHKSGADKAALTKVAVELMAAQFTRILRLETEMEPGKPLMAYGVDSLASVELRNWARMELGADLTTLDITNASSLITLCEKLVSKLPQEAAPA
ncbi:MAG: Type I Iterative PKS [Bathelium mastoideum]|nr:MAG: Type I Iterative PKS [Bathelium mastoideum]